MNFEDFYKKNNDIQNIKLASNPRHRTGGALTNPNRKNPNLVARSQNPNLKYSSANVVSAKFNGGTKKLTEFQAQEEAKKYNINLQKRDKSKPFQISLKQKSGDGTGRFLSYYPQKGYFIEIKKV